ncbi:COesterase domain-containing protein [Mycena chlorophos]|uniref:Carboxylic ester hydrolase n=1 Tax=Mycena chlorophos TaxID=658473 RepID=A0A8H6TGG2_MYCCL|nr:COesterase domain-containing protein [Mycena chlorophos]
MLPLPLVSVLASSVAVLASAQAPTVDLGYAQYQGSTTGNITSFLGIRYAAAPVGDLRFAAPQPPANVSGVQQATAQPNQCNQASTGMSPTNPLESRATTVASSEDCLFLNVYYPSDATGTPPSKLPTLVWIHGGGYIEGNAGGANGGDIIAQSNNGVVVVVIQYRLGIFGFLPGSAVKNGGALNAGLLDQDFALRWIQAHITKFGGDPAKVTIWGESAGAGSVLQHVIAHGGKTKPQLFRGAITSSTFLPSQYVYSDRLPELLYSEVLMKANCTTASDTLACLRAVPEATIAPINNAINIAGFYGTFLTVPVIDGDFIQESPTAALKAGKVNGQALLSVTNAFEGNVFVNASVSVTPGDYSLELFPYFGTPQSSTVDKLYDGLGPGVFGVDAVMGESIFICPTYYLLSAFPSRSWKGEFAIPPALHGNDVAYYFPNGVAPPFNNTQFIDAFAQSFTSFIINLDPNKKVSDTITPHWAKYSVNGTQMLFNETSEGKPEVVSIGTDSSLLERCSFWNSVANITGQ